MKIDYVEKGVDGSPMIRIYGEESFDTLIEQFFALSKGENNVIIVEELPGYISIDACHLLLQVGIRNEGVRKNSDHNNGKSFTWTLTRSSWGDVATLAEPLERHKGNYYQWLAGKEVRMENLSTSDISLLISSYPTGEW